MTAPNHVKAWREHRRMTQAALAALIGTNASVVSLLEAGRRGLTPKWLRRLSTALSAPVGAFMEYAPDQGRADVLDLWAAVPESSRPIALEIMRGFCRQPVAPARGRGYAFARSGGTDLSVEHLAADHGPQGLLGEGHFSTGSAVSDVRPHQAHVIISPAK